MYSPPRPRNAGPGNDATTAPPPFAENPLEPAKATTTSAGTSPESATFQGKGAGGTAADGTVADGTVADGTVADGTAAEGAAADGTAAEGAAADGTAPEGAAADRSPRLPRRKPNARLPKGVAPTDASTPAHHGADEVLLKRIRTALRALR
jgi:hypothetical protein